MATKNLSRNETSYLYNGGVNTLIQDFYKQVLHHNGIPNELKPHWDLLKGLLISSKTLTTDSTDDMVTYILAVGELSLDRSYAGGVA